MDGKALGQFVPLILIFVIFYFLLIRPQQKRIKEHKAMVEALTRGDSIVTAGGLVGKVVRILDNDKAEIEISENVNVQVVKTTISQVLSKTEPKK
jgi:preprotein translocase subunit YajC